MNRYSGVIGIRLPAIETSPGIFEDVIEEVEVVGEIFRKPARWSGGEAAQNTLRMNQVIGIVAPESIQQNLDNIVFATYQDHRWVVVTMEYNRPRLEMSLGGVYHG